MIIVQLIKQLNNTELGKGGTHDTYVLIPNELDITEIFEEPNKVYEFVDLYSNETVSVRNTIGREKRIVGLGQYYRNHNLSAGDAIVFEKRILEDNEKYLVHCIKLSGSIVFQKMKNGFEILTPERLQTAQVWGSSLEQKFEVDFLEAIKKRNDSPDTTDLYSIKIGGISILNDFSAKEIGIVEICGNVASIRKFFGWKLLRLEEK